MIVTNGTFTTDTSGWSAGNGSILSVVANRLRVTNSAALYGYAYQAITVIPGQSYKVIWDDFSGTSTPNFTIGNSSGSTEYVSQYGAGLSQSVTFTPTQTPVFINCWVGDNVNGDYADFDNINITSLGLRVTTGDVLVATTGKSPESRITAADVLVAYNIPSPEERTSGAASLVTVKSTMPLRITNAAVLVAVKGRTANPKLRAWTFTLDGHDFYVLRLGTMGTLVYDLYSDQWMDWDAFGQIYWPVNVGINWVDGEGVADTAGNTFGSNVLVGDDTNPLLYILEPIQPYDQASDPLDPQQQNYFPRVLQGQVQMTGRQTLPCYAVWLTTDMGAPAYGGAGVTLEISDDAGVSYQNMGTVSVTPGVNSPELVWTSLGQIGAPGRLFRITDDGAVARIDAMEMNDPDQK